MKTLILTAAAAALALSAGAADAASKHRAHAGRNVLVGPEQPIPYGRLNAYSRASAKARATQDWWTPGAVAAADSGANASANAPGTPIDGPVPSAANPGVSSSQPAGAASSATAPPSATSASAPTKR